MRRSARLSGVAAHRDDNDRIWPQAHVAVVGKSPTTGLRT